MPQVLLQPIKETPEDYEAIEKAILEHFRREIYLPLMAEFTAPRKALHNARPGLLDAIRSGRITFSRGVFSGKLNSEISKDLRALGAKFDRKTATYRAPLASLPVDVKHTISASESKFEEKLARIDAQLAQKLPAEIAGRLKLDTLFDRALWRVEGHFQKSVKGLVIAPKLTKSQADRLSKEWADNMQLFITDFAESEIKELRQNLATTIFAGNRYGSAVQTIQDSYGVSARKAKFLARQETSLLMTKFKQTRYSDAGVNKYRWGCVSGTKAHPVRPWHKALEGKVFRWDNPPTTTKPGEPVRKNNPGQDYNCRCFARPIVKF